MSTPKAIFRLKPDLYDPRFHGFVFTGAPSCLGFEGLVNDFKVEGGDSLDWKLRSLRAVWKPVNVTGPVNAFNDYPCLELTTPVFSRRAVYALGKMLTDNGELLPLITDVGEYYAYVCLTKVEGALDWKKSRISWPSEPNSTAFLIEYFAFKKTKVPTAAIFRLAEHTVMHFVSDAFKARAEEAALNGLHFIKVWPLPEGTDYDMEDIKLNRNRKAAKLAGHAVILRFQLRAERPSKKEKAAAQQIEESLRKLLQPRSLQDRYWGTVEVTEFVDGELRVFCSCPNCDDLFDYLKDWIESVPLENEIHVMKRYGHIYDRKAKEERIIVR